jgi:hypothetical protein
MFSSAGARDLFALRLVACCSLAAAFSAPARAEEPADVLAAREVAKRGLIAFDEGRCDEAIADLGRAYVLVRVPTLPLHMARCHARSGRLVEAAALYLEASRLDTPGGEAAVQAAARRDARNEYDALMPRVPRIKITVARPTTEPVRLEIDGKPMPASLLDTEYPVNPGPHEIRIVYGEQEGAPAERARVSVEERTVRTLEFSGPPERSAAPAASAPETARNAPAPVDPVAPARPVPRRTTPAPSPSRGQRHARSLGYASFVAAGVTVAVGVTAHVLARSSYQKLDDRCPNGKCPLDEEGTLDDYNGRREAAFVAYGLTAGLATLGTVLMVTTRGSRRAQGRALAPSLDIAWQGPQLNLRGSF